MSQSSVEVGRAAFERRAWREAHEALADADASTPLGAEDLDRLALAAQFAGHTDLALKTLERAYQAWLDTGQPLRAARAAFWTGFRSLILGDVGRANGWLARAQRIVDEHPGDCVERGLLLFPVCFRLQRSGKDAEMHDVAMTIAALGDRLGDADLSVFGRNLQGRALLRLEQVEAGLALLDESMVGVTSSNVSPGLTGIVYCGMIAACQRIHAVDRAREWTRALTSWCDQQDGLVAFAGICLVHRAELLQLGGDWPESLEEARRAAVLTQRTDPGSLGDAHYQEGEIHRLRGDDVEAEAAYERACQHGREPHRGSPFSGSHAERRTPPRSRSRASSPRHPSRSLAHVTYPPPSKSISLAATSTRRGPRADRSTISRRPTAPTRSSHKRRAHAACCISPKATP